jgi:hypothetical protein
MSEEYPEDSMHGSSDKLKHLVEKMLLRMAEDTNKQIAYGLAEGWYKKNDNGILHHTLPEDLGVDPYTVLDGLEDVCKYIYNDYNNIDQPSVDEVFNTLK